MRDAAGPLSDLVILDLTRVLAGPYGTRLLADLGARVIKIERPRDGDDMRKNHLQVEPGRTDQSTYFIRINAGKESVAVDLSHPQGRAVVIDICRVADVFVENFAPGVVEKLGLGYAAMAAVKPDLVYCSISGFGQTGPWRERQAFAHIINAASGMMHLDQGDQEAPRASNLQAADVLAGTHAFGAILAALRRRDRTGQGAYLDVSMLEALVAADDVSYAAVLNLGETQGSPRPAMGVYAVGGRHLALQTGGAAALWPRLQELLGRPELATDPRFTTPDQRRRNWPALRDIIGEWVGRFASVEEALDALRAARIPAAAVLRPDEVAVHPHLAARGAFPTVTHPTRGAVRVTAAPFQLDGQPVAPAGPAPYRVGEHTRAVLGELLGYKDRDIDDLVQAGVIEAP
ncbi:MAG TPA: CaiB/BaiF CoA-transferase family protein [Methylomirabilota bacterium]|nr:CaiB/BaiF CoA-transferase family protein [Methylomirabilota bacterium]